MSVKSKGTKTRTSRGYAPARRPSPSRNCACGAPSKSGGTCEQCQKSSRTPSAMQHAPERGLLSHEIGNFKQSPGKEVSQRRGPITAAFGHDFSEVSVFSHAATAKQINDQTPVQEGGLAEEFMGQGAEPAQQPAPELNLGEEPTAAATTPVIDQVELISSSKGAIGGYPEKEDTCDASLSKPGPFNDPFAKGSVANVHQVHFHLSQGNPGDLRASRVVKRTAEGRGQKFTKSGGDGPPEHEYRFTKDKLVIADAPGWCSKLVESDFPVSYSGDFALYAWDAPTKKILASIAYHVEIKKMHYSQGDPVNTVSVTDTRIGGLVDSPVKSKKKGSK